jgi:hypothetical protein
MAGKKKQGFSPIKEKDVPNGFSRIPWNVNKISNWAKAIRMADDLKFG